MPMLAAPQMPATAASPAHADQRVLLHGVSWKDYVIVREALDSPGVRMTHCEGALEIMRSSRNHELWKTNIARLIETMALEMDLPLYCYGSTTFRNQALERGAEPDECYRVRAIMHEGELPDIVLEVIHLSPPLIDKLRVYSGLGVKELWFFRDGRFELHRLREGSYAQIQRSEALPEIDLDLVAQYATSEDQHAAVKELRDRLRRR